MLNHEEVRFRLHIVECKSKESFCIIKQPADYFIFMEVSNTAYHFLHILGEVAKFIS